MPSFSKRREYKLVFSGKNILLGERTHVMGIINVTPDSFSKDGCLIHRPRSEKALAKKIVLKAKMMIKDGADMLDIGGESTRPGAKRINIDEEKKRVIPVIAALAKTTKVPISIDSYKPHVIKSALDAGASIVNSIMGAEPDKGTLKMVRDYDAAIVLMHMKGNPRTMQKNVKYKGDVVKEIINILKKSIEKCLEIGIKSNRIIIDPGIGFGKTVEHNLEIINRLDSFAILKKPVLIGPSRKSFIGKILNKDVGDRLIGTVSSVCASILRGAHIVRVHDVKEVKEAVTLTDAVLNEAFPNKIR